ncbi:2'-5' RNA ligase family protein [Bradyrhizobium prioriisuperbiae]|uniref:2'-5' RNA ligase family protein n=1 Tax=Bradyrhizobium prioriisuperbiae TaxID=2854389 RepID=UPI0028E3BDFA|nr:2'-5' RNA ligase family protein [Bradyrhizobium prioritasuperba]
MVDLGYPPHVTLAVYDTLDRDAALIALDCVFAGRPALDFALTLLETFGAESGVLYAALAVSDELQQLQSEVVTAITGDCRLHYQSQHWTPHCTMATGLSAAKLDATQRLLQQYWQSRPGVFQAAELIEFVPVTSIRRWDLAPR